MNRVTTLFAERWQRIERPLVDALYLLLLLALVIATGWLGARHDRYWDLSSAGRNSLGPQSLSILGHLEQPPSLTVFADPESTLGRSIARFLARYQQAIPALEIRFVDPRRFPEQAREAEVSLLGQILIDYRSRRALVDELSERALSGAFARLLIEEAPWVAVIEGHGERSISGTAPADLGRLGTELEEQGYRVRPLDLARVSEVPVNTHLVVLSMPAISLFPGEVERLREYLDRGGNLLWLLDPGPLNGLERLAESLELTPLPGLVIDPAARRLGVSDPAVVALIEGAQIRALRDRESDQQPALLPGALAFEPRAPADWTLSVTFESSDRSWNETGRLDIPLERDEVIGESAGPLSVGLALTRPIVNAGREQRVLVLGDGDFMSNAYLGMGGNQALALAAIGWLGGAQTLLELPPLEHAPEALELSDQRRVMLGVLALVLLPGSFAMLGLVVRWWRWRER